MYDKCLSYICGHTESLGHNVSKNILGFYNASLFVMITAATTAAAAAATAFTYAVLGMVKYWSGFIKQYYLEV